MSSVNRKSIALRGEFGPKRMRSTDSSRFVADLERGEPQVHVLREALAARLIEHAPAAVQIGELAEPPEQIVDAVAGPDGIAERDPAAAGDLVHQERASVVAEQQAFVAH